MKNSSLPGTVVWLSIIAAAAMGAGCSNPNAPTPVKAEIVAVTAATTIAEGDVIWEDEVDPVVVDYTGYTFEHDPNAPGVSVCQTQPREYCSPDGTTCQTEIDLYTVMAPETCPTQPIE